MKRTTIAKTFTVAALSALALGIAPTANAHDKTCSNATLKGTFALRLTGFITSPPANAGPWDHVGTLIFDGKGAIGGGGTGSLNGNIVEVTQTGTYTVNPDCTGALTLHFAPFDITGTGFFVIDDAGNELQLIETDPGTVRTGVARKQFPVVRHREETDPAEDRQE